MFRTDEKLKDEVLKIILTILFIQYFCCSLQFTQCFGSSMKGYTLLASPKIYRRVRFNTKELFDIICPTFLKE